ncbi:MAG: hypothetical protein GY725_07960 [bacterium]|nr:hypothetical protein [bacterium]
MSTNRTAGNFRVMRHRRTLDIYPDPVRKRERRIRAIISSIQRDVDEGGRARVRQILKGPCELYRLELELPEMSYQRTTILDRDTLTELLEQTPEETVRQSFVFPR